MSIQVSKLTKIYGTQKAVNAISFEVRPGDILGFLGPNGAGKSTTMKIATGYLPPSSGEVKVAGFDVVKEAGAVRQNIGYLPEHNPLYLDMYVHEYLGFIASLHGIKGKKRKERVAEIISLCGLTVEQNKQISMLSKGYRQRVGLAQALIHDPKVLILDEPTTGLDPNQLAEIRKLIKEISKDKTVILSTHIMQEVKALCNRVIIINKGEIVANDTVERLTAGGGAILKVEFQSEVQRSDLATLQGIQEIKGKGNQYSIKAKKDLREQLFKLAADKGWVILSMQLEEQNLEEIFQQLTNNGRVGDI
jgi:ABC-2 type transport system ATP-binding protein